MFSKFWCSPYHTHLDVRVRQVYADSSAMASMSGDDRQSRKGNGVQDETRNHTMDLNVMD